MKFLYRKKVPRVDNLKNTEENDKCLLCNCDTGYKLMTPIFERLYYVVGCGQMCKECYSKLYKKDQG